MLLRTVQPRVRTFDWATHPEIQDMRMATFVMQKRITDMSKLALVESCKALPLISSLAA